MKFILISMIISMCPLAYATGGTIINLAGDDSVIGSIMADSGGVIIGRHATLELSKEEFRTALREAMTSSTVTIGSDKFSVIKASTEQMKIEIGEKLKQETDN